METQVCYYLNQAETYIDGWERMEEQGEKAEERIQ